MSDGKQHVHPLSSVFNAITSEKISPPRPPYQLSCYASQALNFPPRTSLLHFPAAWPSDGVCHNVFSAPRASGGPTFFLSGRAERQAEVRGVQSTEQKNAKMSAKWPDAQTNVLVEEWKERIEEVESRRNSEAWQKIAEEVNTAGTLKSIKQCKDKLRNMKQAYKDAKSNNIETGCPPKRSPFYEEFDEVLGSRPVVPAPDIIQAGVNSSAGSPSGSTMSQDLADSNSDGSDVEDLQQGEKRRKHAPQTPTKKRMKKTPHSSAVVYALTDVAEQILAMQSVQINALERAQARTEDLLVKLDAEQRRYDEAARCRDHEFFLRLAETLKK